MGKLQNKICVILVDDHKTIHLEIGSLLATLEDIDLVAQGYNGQEAVQLCDKYRPDVLLIDISMPIMNGITATKIIMTQQPDIKVIALSGMGDMAIIQEMIAAGAVGYLLKYTQPEELASTIRAVHSGKSVFSTEIIKPLLNRTETSSKTPQDYGLTRREIEILYCMVEGQTNSEIAKTLMISIATVKFHISNILRKLGTNTRSAAIGLAIKQRLI